MGRGRKPKEMLVVVAAALAMVAVVCGCPLGLMWSAPMTAMMGGNMGGQGMAGMCPMLCGVRPSSPSFESNGFVLGPLPVDPAPNPASKIRPVFHPPPVA